MRTRKPESGGLWSRLRLGLLVAMLLVALLAQPGAATTQSGGIFRISIAQVSGLDHIDPALSYTPVGWMLIDTTCARLMAYPDKPPPAGYRVAPEVAASFPKVSRDRKTYTFTLRRGFRFNDGKPVRASAFAHAINRMRAPAVKSPGAVYVSDIRGVVARGYKLVVRFTSPAPDFAVRTTLPFFCAVPPNLPPDPEGVRELPGAGPYYISGYRPDERVVIRRNRFYGGKRPHHVDGFDVDLRAASPQDMIQRIDRGDADWGHTVGPQFLLPELGLVRKYGTNRSRLFVKPGLTMRMFAFNLSRPLFRDNPGLRRAINFAFDRQALQNVGGGPLSGVLTDQYLPRTVPGFRDAAVYPLARRNLKRARELASGNLRSARAVLYTTNAPPPLAAAQLAKQQLAAIGLDVDIKAFPIHIARAAYLEKLVTRGEPWDIALVLWSPNVPDPFSYINSLLDGQFLGMTNVTGPTSGEYSREMRRVAQLTRGPQRLRAYGQLDARLARDVAPLAAINVLHEVTFVSNRVARRCMILRPALDLAAVCLK
jgi:peptide/nickel transport system substrate-binding protein